MANTRTLKYYRITGSREGEEVTTLPQFDWPEFMRGYRDRDYVDRIHTFDGSEYYFEPRATDIHHVAIHKFKERGEVLSYINRRDGDVKEIAAVDDEGTYADTSCVVFLPFGNIFGIVLNGSSAPRAGRISDWLTRLDPYQDETHYGVWPLTMAPDTDKLADADGATKITVRVPVETLDTMMTSGFRTDAFSSLAPGTTAELTLSYGRHQPKMSDGSALLGFVKRAASVLTGGQGTRAQVSIYRAVESQTKTKKARLEHEMIDLIEYELAESIPIGEQTGQAKIDAIMSSIDLATTRLMPKLRRSWEAINEDEDKDKGLVGGPSA